MENNPEMDSSNASDSHEVSTDLFEDLRKYEINVPSHLVAMLVKMGFTTVQALARLSTAHFDVIENTVRNVFSKLYENSAPDEKSQVFGIFYNNTELFQILPGERAQIIAAVEYAKRVVQGYDELLMKAIQENRGNETVWPMLQPLQTLQVAQSPPGSGQVTPPTPKSRPRRREFTPDQLSSPRSITVQVHRWVRKNQKNILYTEECCLIDEEKMQVKCVICKPPVVTRIYADQRNNLKISNFTRHVLTFHGKFGAVKVKPSKKLADASLAFMVNAVSQGTGGSTHSEEVERDHHDPKSNPAPVPNDPPAGPEAHLSQLFLAYGYGGQIKAECSTQQGEH